MVSLDWKGFILLDESFLFAAQSYIYMCYLECRHKKKQASLLQLSWLLQFHVLPNGVTVAPLTIESVSQTPYLLSSFALARTRAHFKPGWMTSPLRLGFLYDPGISRFPHQTSAGSAGEHISLSLTLSLSANVFLSLSAAASHAVDAPLLYDNNTTTASDLWHTEARAHRPTNRDSQSDRRHTARASPEQRGGSATDHRHALRPSCFSDQVRCARQARPPPCPRCCHTTRAR